ncbi:MAG: outer membrane protein assembly factor BamD [Gammaproteobacteria bacterium]|nr:outer membrane protein assembly factor BamD [Gammaproteobacteria bacterium]
MFTAQTTAPLTSSTSARLLLSVLITTIALSGCSWMPFIGKKDKDREPDIDTSEQVLYRNTQRSLRAGNYDQAISGLQLLEARFPFGRYAEQAQLEIIYAQYMSYDHDTARLSADRFMRLHPQHANIDYAYYLKGLAAFNKNRGLLDRLFATDLSKRDMTSARESYADFAQLLARHPDSQYAPDATKRMVYLRNMLADSELHIADYYMRRGAYVAASNRARYVVENYSKSLAAADALAIMVEANWKLGLPDAANDALRVLAVNYPRYDAFDENGDLVLAEQVRNRDRSWTNLVTLGLLDRPDVPPPIKLEHPEGFVPPPVDPASEPAPKKKKRGMFSWLPFIG